MKLEKNREHYYFIQYDRIDRIEAALPRINQIFRNYNNLIKERNLAETQLMIANNNIEMLLAELRKFDRSRYPQPTSNEG